MASRINLQTLLQPWIEIEDPTVSTISLTNLYLDSRKVGKGDLFIAIRGHAVDGRRFIPDVIAQGACAVVAEADEEHQDKTITTLNSVPIIYLADLNQHLSQLAGRLYRSDSSALIGVTGTNGKTTISQLIAQWCELLGHRAGVMGTTGNGFLDDLKPALNTTGNAIEIQETLAELADKGAKHTVLEVSSHGLVQGRVNALEFSVGIFTNLSRDHLDYHGTMEEYALAKKRLFTDHDCKQAILNIDDPVGLQWLDDLPDAIAVSLSKPELLDSGTRGDVLYAKHVSYSEEGIAVDLDGNFGTGCLRAPLIGQFNASNLMLALAAMLSQGFSLAELIRTAVDLKPVIGRMELFQTTGKAKVVVDYAHTPDALEKALQALRVHCSGKLWAIFGCGGDRDKGKRPLMAQAGERLADHIILADDNPRSESPRLIIEDMLEGLESKQSAKVEHDRFKALAFAVKHAASDDIILLAGKGHEDYQVVGTENIHYSDRESAIRLLELSV